VTPPKSPVVVIKEENENPETS